jgi:hypothetical protein
MILEKHTSYDTLQFVLSRACKEILSEFFISSGQYLLSPCEVETLSQSWLAISTAYFSM